MPGPMRTQATPGSGELAKLAADLGIDVSALGGATSADPDEPTVFFGSGPRVKYVASPKFVPNKPRGQRDITKTLSQANAAFYEMDENDLVKLQRRLIAIGILDPKKTPIGDYDEDTFSAFSAINERTARFNAVGKKLTPSDVLGMIEKSALAAGFGQDAEETAIEPGNVNRTTNPLTIEQQMQEVARVRLGRKLNTKEVQKFVSLYRGMEGGYNAKMNAAEDAVQAGGDATIEEQAPVGAAADQFIDANYTNEAGGQDAYGYLGALKNLLGG